MTTLILIRHGESEANRQGVFSGQNDPDLQSKGLKQAQLTAKYIADNYKVDKIYSSDLRRAYKTAVCLAAILDLEVISEQNLREINAGAWEGMKFEDLILTYPEEFDMWLYHIGRAGCVGGETVEQLGNRTMSALTKIANEHNGKTVVIATHATPIRAAQSLIESGSLEKMENIPWVSNASVSVFEYHTDSWKVIEVNRDEHLFDLKTVLPTRKSEI